MRAQQTNHVTKQWVFNEPPKHLQHSELTLLTIAGVAIDGNWSGRVGEFFSAYALPMRNDQTGEHFGH